MQKNMKTQWYTRALSYQLMAFSFACLNQFFRFSGINDDLTAYGFLFLYFIWFWARLAFFSFLMHWGLTNLLRKQKNELRIFFGLFAVGAAVLVGFDIIKIFFLSSSK